MSGPIQGLRVTLRLADVANPIEALRNLNINILDLDRIRGIAAEGVLPEDIRIFSGLNSDVEKELIGIYDESLDYSNYLSHLNDARTAISANMTANASIIGASFKFNSLVANGSIVTSEISTSRASAWSSLGDTLYYGAKVTVGNDVELSSLTIDSNIRTRKFASEIPTHKVRINIDGQSYDAYAMKNIPIKFTGYFSTARGIFFNVSNANPTDSSFLPPSWEIRDIDTGSTITYRDVIASSGVNRNSTITFTSSRAKEREIMFYYPTNNIRTISLPNLRLYEIPTATLPNVTSIILNGSDFSEMPDFRTFAPNATSLNISDVNLMRSDDSDLRYFSEKVVERLPTTLTTLFMDNTFAGPVSANLAIITNLSVFAARGNGSSGRRLTGTSPAVNPLKIDSYYVNENQLTEIHPSVRESDTLRILNISNNNIPASANVQISATNQAIEEIYANGSACAFIDVSNKSNLKRYNRVNSNATGIVTGIFNNCTSLIDINLWNTRITGALPSFATNGALITFNAWNTLIQPASANYSIDESTFGGGALGGCRLTLKQFRLYSPRLNKPIHENAMDDMVSLELFHISSSRSSGITGNVPQFRQSSKLNNVYMAFNKFTGTLPSFSSNPNLARLNIAKNLLSGSIPSLRLSRLTSLILDNNLFDGIGDLQCPLLVELNVGANLIPRIPSFNDCRALQIINMSANPMTGSSAVYTTGTFAVLTSLRNLNLTNCGIQRSYIDQILIDLATNYDANPRSRVVIDLTGNDPPSANDEIQIFVISRLRAAGWTIRTA